MARPPRLCRNQRVRSIPALAVLAFLSTACPQSISTPDGDSDGGSGLADATAAADAETFPDALSSDADEPSDAGINPDATPRDATDPDDAGATLQPLTWSQMTLPNNSAFVRCIWGRSADEIYAGTSNGQLMAFTPATGWTNVWRDPSNFAIHAIWGTANTIFVASETTLHVHTPGIQQVPVSHSVGRFIYDIHGISDNEVFLVSDLQNGRAYFKYDGNGVDLVLEPAGVATLASVFGDSSTRTYLGGNGHLIRYESFTAFEEDVTWPAAWSQNDILQFEFRDITRLGSRLVAIGSRYLIFERDTAGVWNMVHQPFLTDSLNGITGFENEAYAVGGDVTGGSILRFYENTWTTGHYDNNVDLYGIWAADADNYFVAGTVNNTFTGIILRGSR
jgi:hypothetical protein